MQDLESLSHKARRTHIGELDDSWLKDSLPPQFLVLYDYDFLYYFRYIVMLYRLQASSGTCFSAHTVIILVLIFIRR